MKQLGEIVSRLKLESSIIIAMLLTAGLIAYFRDTSSWISTVLLVGALFIAVLGFVVLSIRESYESLIAQKDEMIKNLTKERSREVKHSENLRARVEKQATGGWEQTVAPIEEI